MPDRGYDKFVKVRYSDRTIEQSAAVFGWGSEDTESLKKIYIKSILVKYIQQVHLEQIYGKQILLIIVLQKYAEKTYLLVSSNMYSISNIIPFYKYYKYLKDSGYSKLDSDFFLNQFKMAAEDSHKTGAFINAINYLANNNNGFDIVFTTSSSGKC